MQQTIVIKFGSSSLVSPDHTLSPSKMIEFVRQIAELLKEGHRIVLVSSGAIAAGKGGLPYSSLSSLPTKQMYASIGQVHLMQTWAKLFEIYEIPIGQVLLTREDFADPRRTQNAANTFEALLSHQILPIVNENDTVSTEEICLGDNDHLSAQVARLIKAQHLILLTDQEGLYTADPRFHSHAELIQTVETIDEKINSCAKTTPEKGVGTGGMQTKIEAAKLAREQGISTVIASSHHPDILLKLMRGEKIGTFFPPKTTLTKFTYEIPSTESQRSE
ncbi:MAG: Glutamate 5-kinase [Chlamydiae bacterium]|nr:Glutamate 5-kinase [Chlamydiota bacterium]